nr:hypothetical protein [uncultured Bacteroides sp.]
MKTNYLRLSLIAWVTTAFMASCSQNEVIESISDPESRALAVAVSANGFDAADAETRVSDNGTATVFQNGDEMGLYIIENPGTADARVNLRNIKLSFDGTKWSAGGNNIYYYKNADYIAYFPYNPALATDIAAADVETKIKEAGDAILTANQSSQNEEGKYHAADLMMAKVSAAELAAQEAADKTLNFALKHQYSMIEIAVPVHRFSYKKADGVTSVDYDVPMQELKLKVGVGADAASAAGAVADAEFYSVGNGVYRYLINPNAIHVEGSFIDPEDMRPVEFSNTNAANKTLTAGSYIRYNVTFNGADGNPVNFERKERNIIGDYFCQDGVVFPSDFQVLPKNIVGIVVAKVGENDFPVEAGKFDYYVLSIKSRKGKAANATTNITGVTNVELPSSTDISTLLAEMNGWSNTQALQTANADIATDLVNNWAKNADFKLSENIVTSGWFVPSIGQWCKIQTDLLDASTITYTYNSTSISWSSNTKGQVNAKLDALVKQLSTNGYSLTSGDLSFQNGTLFWSSTQTGVEGDNSKQYVVEIKGSEFTVKTENKTTDTRVRCPMLAF